MKTAAECTMLSECLRGSLSAPCEERRQIYDSQKGESSKDETSKSAHDCA